VVSTDDPEIAAIARAFGAEVPFLRPAELAIDTSSSLSALLHALDYVERVEDYRPDAVAFLPPTAPLRTADQIDDALTMLWASDVDSVIGVNAVDQHPYMMFEQDAAHQLSEYVRLSNKPLRRQEFPPLYAINGSLYLSRRRYFDHCADPQPIFNWHHLKGLPMDRFSSVDINAELDFLFAETLMAQRADTLAA